MKILLTGASGFLGKIAIPILQKNHELISVGRSPENNVIADIGSHVPELPGVDAVVHAAGKAHIYPKTEEEKQAFFDVNVKGTQHVLDALSTQNVQAFVFISSVSVYGLEQGEHVQETTPLNGKSPYALSKIEAETLIKTWCEARGINYLILRLPLIVGLNPLGNLGKMLHGIQHKKYLRIAKGDAKKSMVLASDVAILINSWLLNEHRISGIYNLTDGMHPTFFQLEEGIKHTLGIHYIPSIPAWFATLLGRIGDQFSFFPVNSGTIKKITCTFTFDDQKAKQEIGWMPRPVLQHLDELIRK